MEGEHKFLNNFGKLVYNMGNNNTRSLPNTTYKDELQIKILHIKVKVLGIRNV